ncbi:MAG: hypothetical protein IPN86_19405 [Saprospiraceae bacterium]|nr:hypothetical protein [Saprospiraceae bacterium]
MRKEDFDKSVKNKLLTIKEPSVTNDEVQRVLSVIHHHAPVRWYKTLYFRALSSIVVLTTIILGSYLISNPKSEMGGNIEKQNHSESAVNMMNGSMVFNSENTKPNGLTELSLNKEDKADAYEQKDSKNDPTSIITSANTTTLSPFKKQIKGKDHISEINTMKRISKAVLILADHHSPITTTDKQVNSITDGSTGSWTAIDSNGNIDDKSSLHPLAAESIVNKELKLGVSDIQEYHYEYIDQVEPSNIVAKRLEILHPAIIHSKLNGRFIFQPIALNIPALAIIATKAQGPIFRIGLFGGGGHERYEAGVVSELIYKKRWSIVAGIKLKGYELYEYEDGRAYNQKHKKPISEQYANLPELKLDSKDIEIYRSEIIVPLSIQYYQPFYKSWSVFASTGLDFKWKDIHNVSFENNTNGTDIMQAYNQTYDSAFHPSLHFGAGLQKTFGRFSSQLLFTYSKNDDNNEEKIGHHSEGNVGLQLRCLYQLQK